MDASQLRQKLAAIEHERWSDWQNYMYGVLLKSGELTEGVDEILQHWNKQAHTPYEALSVDERLSDMEQVDRYWPLIEAYIDERTKQLDVKQVIEALDKLV